VSGGLDLAEVAALIAAAGDVEAFSPEPVARELLASVCEAATGGGRAGSPPCRVLIVVGDERERLIAQVASALSRHWGADALAPTGLGSEAILSAPAFVLVFASQTADPGFDVGAAASAAAQNLVLLGRAAGLGTHRILAARVVPEVVLDFAAGYLGGELLKGDLIAMFAIGHARSAPAPAGVLGTVAWADGARADPPVAAAALQPPTQLLRASRGERVALVELYPHHRATIRAQLEVAGYRVEVCPDAHTLEEQSARDGDPDLFVLSDILPDTTAFELVRRLRGRRGSRAPVIVTTSRRDTAFRIAGLAVGVDYYLRKPLSSVELLGAARLLLDRQAALDELRRANAELERLLSELRTAQARIVQQGKMAALGQLVAGVAHEINTPLAAIVSNNDLFARAFQRLREGLERHGPESDGREHLAIIEDLTRVSREAGRRITDIVRTLRTFARLDESELKAVDLHEGLESTLVLLAHQLKSGVAVVRDYGELPPVECNPNQLNQVFMNLMVNACQAMAEVGTLTLRTRRSGDGVLVQIADTGCGIPEERIGRIFDPGYTTKGAAIGTGLGLAIVYQLVEAHGGEITVESEVGRGTTFSLRLPLARHAVL
jgi:signal transduction histidine kinase